MKEMRRAIKDRLYDSCKDIFNGDAEYLRNLRFPEQYKQMLLTVNHLAHVFPDRPPIYHTWDTQVNHQYQTSDPKPLSLLLLRTVVWVSKTSQG